MEIIAEFLFELIIEGLWEASSEKKVPFPVRIIAAIILIGFYGGLIGLCFYSGFRHRNPAMFILGALILVITVPGARAIYRKHRTHEN